MKFCLPIFLFITLILNIGRSYAQESTWEIGGGIGGAGYMGEFNLNNPLKFSGINANLFAKKNVNGMFGVRFNYSYGQIKGDDAKSENLQEINRNLNFQTSINEVAALMDFNLFEFNAGGDFGKTFTPYIFTGVAAFHFNPKASYNGQTYNLAGFTTEGQAMPYKKFAISIPYGIGMKYNYKGAWSIFSELGYRTAFTDYIDDVSGRYPASPTLVGSGLNVINLSDPSINQIGVYDLQRGDFRKRDTYLFVSVGISFTFVNSKCFSL
jgi:hypothetical protein